MEIKAGDITLDKFLKKFTFVGDPDPNKTKLEMPVFLQIASILKLELTIQNAARFLK